MARFMLIPHAPGGTLAHLAACMSVAEALRADGHEPVFAYGGTREELLDDAGFEWLRVEEATGPMNHEWFQSDEQLERIVASQVGAIRDTKPDACITSVGAGRLSVVVAGTPHLSLMHTLGTSPFGRLGRRRETIISDLRHPSRAVMDTWLQLKPRPRHRSAQVWRRGWIEHTGSRLERPEGATGRADLVACTTMPLLDPAPTMPDHWRYVGPLGFSLPGGSAVALETERPRAYISQGSTGAAELLRQAVAEVAGAGFAVVASTGGLCRPEELRGLGDGVEAAELHDTRAELRAADVAVIGGGHMTAMESLLAGVPTVVVPHTSGQALSAKRAERLGTGLGRWPLTPRGTIGRAARRVHSNERFAARAEELAAQLNDGAGERAAAALAVELSR